MQDKILVCKNCGKEFTFSVSEQEFFAKNGLTNEPSKCKDCRRKAREEKQSRQSTIQCIHCGKQEHVTFTVAHPETLLCDDCFHQLQPVYATEKAPTRELVGVDLEQPHNQTTFS